MRDLVRPPLLLPWPRLRLALAWLLAVGAGAIALGYAWAIAFHDGQRADRNSGHSSIDFGGQWLIGRMIVEGEGRRLYHRDTIREVLDRAYPRADEDPAEGMSDAAKLMDWLQQGDDEIAPRALGGPLYPPVHGLLYAPMGLLSPRVAYRLMQTTNLLLVFVLGWMAERLSGGRVWMPVASLLLMLWPGYAGAINLGQNSVLSLFLLTLGWYQAMRGRPILGGIFWGLLAFKPVWAVAFFPVTVLTGRWRMALGMAATGLTLIALTLPLVGIQSWFDWLSVGRIAAQGYARDTTWIILSRDLQGAVRRGFLIEPNAELATHSGIGKDGSAGADSLAGPNAPLPTRLALGLWLVVLAAYLLFALWRRRTVKADDGPGAAFMLLGAWLSCFHFMYYDTLLAALPVLVLFAPTGGKKVVPFAVVVLLIGLYYLSTTLDPTYHFPPFDTYLLLGLWAWCGWQIQREDESDAARILPPSP